MSKSGEGAGRAGGPEANGAVPPRKGEWEAAGTGRVSGKRPLSGRVLPVHAHLLPRSRLHARPDSDRAGQAGRTEGAEGFPLD